MIRKPLRLSIKFLQGAEIQTQSAKTKWDKRGRFSAWSIPLMGRSRCTVPWRKLLWEGVSLAMHYPLFLKSNPEAFPDSKWLEGNGAACWWVGHGWSKKPYRCRRKCHQKGEEGRGGKWCWARRMSATLFTHFLQASCKTNVLLCCIQKSLWWALCVISQPI